MKNIFLSLMVFVVISLLHMQFTGWAVRYLGLPGGVYGIYSILILAFCSVIAAIGLVTVIIFRKHYYSILRIAILFEIIYLLFLFFSRINPFVYLSDPNNENLLKVFMYGIGLAILFIMYLIHLVYSKIILSQKTNIDQ
ncbi:hypothetical protein EG349_15635 [Chryseobacterium shandongense]|jgi:hypothetical protein|uniref:Uncharacterized protein n=1 Tax=Chryseobacterium shandongense TaxID=1493872 RepID=A0AAD0YGH1_9FLAO|nr:MULTISPECIES: hypothetical protein [Chryseobacterium]AZA88123.1 hypothetical protein EG349_15635 [Chryseobacterium shandongense]AZA96684.1 hypothetical protein EG353_14420 [Chryseobacterium shandongense]